MGAPSQARGATTATEIVELGNQFAGFGGYPMLSAAMAGPRRLPRCHRLADAWLGLARPAFSGAYHAQRQRLLFDRPDPAAAARARPPPRAETALSAARRRRLAEAVLALSPRPRYMRAMPIDESRAFLPVRIAVLTVSDSRIAADDRSGDTLVERLEGDGHILADRAIVRDEVGLIVERLRGWIADPDTDVVVATGGTGVTGRDVTPEAFRRVWDKEIEGFGELFRWLSYAKIGTSTIQSRACAGVAGGTYLFALPGSTGAVRDGWDGILSAQLDSRHRPCNFVELMPRLAER